MRAVVITTPGGPEVLQVRDVTIPDIPYQHVRVKVRHAALNRADLLQRAGFYPAPPGVPADIPGLEYMGTIDQLGPGCSQCAVGDRVYGIVGGGAYSEYVVVHEREVVKVPSNLSDTLAAAVPEAFITAYDALVCQAAVQPGEKVLIHAVASGVGSAAAQIVKALGATVVGTSRQQSKLDKLYQYTSLDLGVVATNGQFADSIKQNLGPVDVVLDLVGGNYFEETLRTCALKARVVVVGLTAGATSSINLGLLLRQRITVMGTVLRSRPLEEKIAAARLLAGPLGAMLLRGHVKPIVDKIFSLENVADAHRYLAENDAVGKVLLDINSEQQSLTEYH